MPNIDPKITVPEGQTIYKSLGGHNHDGIVSSLIDTSSYSIYDFTMGVRETNLTTARGRRQQSNELAFKTLVVQAVEERILDPKGITLKANTITSNEIATGTIKAENLSANLVLVNNIIRSSNYSSNPASANGWIIYSNGSAEFNQVTIRGNIYQGNGNYQNSDTKIFANIGGYFSLGSNLGWNGSSLTIRGTLQFPNGSTPGTFNNGDNLTSGTIGGIIISSSSISGSSGVGSFALYSNGLITTSNANIGGIYTNSGIGFSETSTFYATNTNTGGTSIYEDQFNSLRFITFTDLEYTHGSPGLTVFRESRSLTTNTLLSNIGYFYGLNGQSNISDIRFKDVYQEDIDALNKIKTIKVITFKFKGEQEDKKQVGFSAQQLYEVIPQIVIVGDEDPEVKPWMISPDKLIPYLTRAIQELSDKVEYLENRLNQIEGV